MPHDSELTGELRTLLGDQYEKVQLLRAREVAHLLGIAPKRVYELPIEPVRIGKRAVRWRLTDVQQFAALC